jgi:hypothetical protein
MATSHATRMRIIAAALCVLAIAAVLGLALVFSGPLVTLHPEGAFALGAAVPGGALGEGVAGPKYSSWNGDDARTGRLVSDRFVVLPIVELALAGGTSRPGETVILRRDDGATLSLAPSIEPGESWVRTARIVPASWWGRGAQLVVSDAGGGFRGWLGAAALRTLLVPNVLQVLGRFALIVVVVLLFAVLAVPATLVAGEITRRRGVPSGLAFGIALVVLGLFAYAAFFSTRASPAFGSTVVMLGFAALWVAAGWIIANPPARRAAASLDLWMPWFVVTSVAFAYGAILIAVTPPDGSVLTTASTLWWQFPPDNVIPDLLAKQVSSGQPPRPFLGDWLSSDRPPLQAGLDLLSMRLLPSPAIDALRYETLGLWLQCWCFGGMYALVRAIGATRRRAILVVLVCLPSGFLFISSVYTWPKLITVAYGLVAIAAGWQVRDARLGPPFGFSGTALGLGFLAHGGVAFTLPVLALGAVVSLGRRGLRPVAIAAVAIALTYVPWSVYQHVVDPPGDRLLKWHLGGQIAPDTSRSATRVILDSYTRTPLSNIVALKIANLERIVAPRSAGPRGSEFFFVDSAIGILLVPLAWLLIVPSRDPLLRGARWLGAVGVGALIFWALAMWSDNVVHVGSYLTMVLLMLAGSIAATAARWSTVLVAAIAAVDFALVWMVGTVPEPVLIAAAVVWLALIALTMFGRAQTPFGDTPASEPGRLQATPSVP